MAQRATSLGPKPSLFFFILFLFLFFSSLFFLFLFFIEKPVFTPQNRFFVCFSVSPFVSLWPSWGLLLFQLIFLCLSLVLFFLPSFLFHILYLVIHFFLFSLLCFVSRCYAVFVVLLVVLFSFGS